MENKRNNFRVVSAVIKVLSVSLPLFLCVSPMFTKVYGDSAILHVYCRIAIMLLAVMSFAMLRLYNSIVQNTRFLIRLREEIRYFRRQSLSLDRTMHALHSVLLSIRSLLSKENSDRDA